MEPVRRYRKHDNEREITLSIRQRSVRVCVIALASMLFVLLLVHVPAPHGHTPATVAAQTSPLSPLVAANTDGAESRMAPWPSTDPLASGHAGLWRAAIVLSVVVGGAAVMVWRQG